MNEKKDENIGSIEEEKGEELEKGLPEAPVLRVFKRGTNKVRKDLRISGEAKKTLVVLAEYLIERIGEWAARQLREDRITITPDEIMDCLVFRPVIVSLITEDVKEIERRVAEYTEKKNNIEEKDSL